MKCYTAYEYWLFRQRPYKDIPQLKSMGGPSQPAPASFSLGLPQVPSLFLLHPHITFLHACPVIPTVALFGDQQEAPFFTSRKLGWIPLLLSIQQAAEYA